MNCIKCNKKLKCIKDDWGSRKLHKKCWKELKEEQHLLFSVFCNDDETLLKHLEIFKKKNNLTKLV